MFKYKTRGTCSQEILIETEGNIITSVEFIGGCRGNTAGLAAAVIGQKAEDIASRLEGIPCRGNTSCPDQLAKAIRAYHD